MQLFGTITKRILFYSSNSRTLAVHCPLKTSNNAGAQWVCSSFSLSLYLFTYGIITFFKVRNCCDLISPVVCSVCYVPIRWKTFILKHLVVVPLYINCIGKKFSDMVLAKKCCNLPFVINGSYFHPFVSFFSIVQLLDGTIFMAMWSQLSTKLGGTSSISMTDHQ